MSRSPGDLSNKAELDCLILENLAISLNPLLQQDSREQLTRPAC